MKHLFIILFAILSLEVTFASGQETILYKADGTLKYDSTFRVSPAELSEIRSLEPRLHSLYAAVVYPRVAYQNGIKGSAIAKIVIDRKNIDAYCEIVKTSDPVFNDCIKNAVHSNVTYLIRHINPNEVFTIYVPFLFDVETGFFMNEIKEKSAIPIKKVYLDGGKEW